MTVAVAVVSKNHPEKRWVLVLRRGPVSRPGYRTWTAEISTELHRRQHGHARVRRRLHPSRCQHHAVPEQWQMAAAGARLRPGYAQISLLLPLSPLCNCPPVLGRGWRVGTPVNCTAWHLVVLFPFLLHHPGVIQQGVRLRLSCLTAGTPRELQKCPRIKTLMRVILLGEFVTVILFHFSSPTPYPTVMLRVAAVPCFFLGLLPLSKLGSPNGWAWLHPQRVSGLL